LEQRIFQKTKLELVDKVRRLEAEAAVLREALNDIAGFASERAGVAYYGAFAKIPKSMAMEQFARVQDKAEKALTNLPDSAKKVMAVIEAAKEFAKTGYAPVPDGELTNQGKLIQAVQTLEGES